MKIKLHIFTKSVVVMAKLQNAIFGVPNMQFSPLHEEAKGVCVCLFGRWIKRRRAASLRILSLVRSNLGSEMQRPRVSATLSVKSL